MKVNPDRVDLMREFSQAPEDALFKQTTVAAWLGCSVSKLERDRWKKAGIPFQRVGPMFVRYRKSDVLAYQKPAERYEVRPK